METIPKDLYINIVEDAQIWRCIRSLSHYYRKLLNGIMGLQWAKHKFAIVVPTPLTSDGILAIYPNKTLSGVIAYPQSSYASYQHVLENQILSSVGLDSENNLVRRVPNKRIVWTPQDADDVESATVNHTRTEWKLMSINIETIDCIIAYVYTNMDANPTVLIKHMYKNHLYLEIEAVDHFILQVALPPRKYHWLSITSKKSLIYGLISDSELKNQLMLIFDDIFGNTPDDYTIQIAAKLRLNLLCEKLDCTSLIVEEVDEPDEP